MAFDRTAYAEQVARVLCHAGDRLNRLKTGKNFSASISAWQPAATDADRNIGDDTSVLVMAARSEFNGDMPVEGENFKDDAGRLYRVQGLRSTPPTHPTIEFICGTVVVPIFP